MFLLKRMPVLLQWILISMVLLLTFMFCYRLFFFYTYSIPGRPFSGSAFLLGLRFDARIVAVIGLAMLLLCLMSFLNPFKTHMAKKVWTITLGIVFGIFLVVYVADFYHYDYLQQRLNASVINFLPDAAISFRMMKESYPLVTITGVILILLYLFTWINIKIINRLSNTARLQHKKYNKWYFIVAGVLMAIIIFGKIGQYPLRWSDAFSLGDDFKGNAALNPFQSFISSLKFKNSSYNLKKVREGYPLMAEYLGVQHPDAEKLVFERVYSYPENPTIRPNIVVVICESFSTYKSSMYGNKLDATPYFNALCKKGVFYNRCFTPAFGTARGIWATITGIPDVEPQKTASRNPAAVNQHTIINDFKTYDKYYFLGGSTTWANIRGVLNNNIEQLRIFEEDSFDAGSVDVWGISDKDLFLAANKELAKENKPFFAVIQTAGNHRPYTIPQKDLKEFKLVNYPSDTLLKYQFSGNDELNAFRYSDYCFKKYFEAAEKEKYFSNTIFVFVGDHGLRGDAGNILPESFTKQGIGAEHVPLLFYAPFLLQPSQVNDVCSQLDVLPSVAYLARQSHRNTTLGRNLFDTTFKKEPVAFIADPITQYVGLVSNEFYYAKNLSTKATDFVSVLNNKPIVKGKLTDSIKQRMAAFTDAWHETSKYLLQNNKKKSN